MRASCRFAPYQRVGPKKAQGATGEQMPVKHDSEKSGYRVTRHHLPARNTAGSLAGGTAMFLKGKKS
jgi:hypothetical protein